MQAEIVYTVKDCYELQMIDANCNNCIHMERDFTTYKKWEDWHRQIELQEFEKKKAKALADAESMENEKQKASALRIANKMRFQFEKVGLLQYGTCKKFDKPVSFLPVTCQIETQHCFQHRKSITNGSRLQNII